MHSYDNTIATNLVFIKDYTNLGSSANSIFQAINTVIPQSVVSIGNSQVVQTSPY